MSKQKLTNEQKFINDIQKDIEKKLKKYGLTNALLLLPDKDGHYKLNVQKPMTKEQINNIPRA